MQHDEPPAPPLTQPFAWAAVAAAAIVVHVLRLAHPLDVLWPVDSWRVGQLLFHGRLPYRDFAFEYPPLSLVAFVLPAAAPHSLAKNVLAAQALILEGAVAWLVLRHHKGAVLRYAALSVFLFGFLSGGFDAFPMAALAVSTALLADRRVSGWVAAAIGTLIKLVPGVAWLWCRTHWRAAIAALAVTALLAAVPLAGPVFTGSYIGYSIKRGVEIDSVAATSAWALRQAAGGRSTFKYGFRSWEIAGAGGLSVVLTVAALLAAAFVALTVRSRGSPDPWVATLVLVVVLLCGSKVLSPQYMAWAAPIAAVVGGWMFVVYAIASALTLAAYSLFTHGQGAGVLRLNPTPLMTLLFIRNLVLLGLASAGVWRLYRGQQSTKLKVPRHRVGG